MLSELQAAASW